MTRIITDDEFVKAFDAAVEERGREFVYPEDWKTDDDNPTCLYNLADSTPACVWGLAFHKLGLPPANGVITDILDMTARPEPDYENVASQWRAEADVEFELTFGVRRAASQAQHAQDAGATWGNASDLFHRALDGEQPGAD